MFSVPGLTRIDGRTPSACRSGRSPFVNVRLQLNRGKFNDRVAVLDTVYLGFVRELVMNKTVVFLVLSVGLASAQLNFEGNPLTENTEYTAEESRFSERTARRQEATTNVANHITDRPQKLYRVLENATKNASQETVSEKSQVTEHRGIQSEKLEGNAVTSTVQPESVASARHFTKNSYNQGVNSVNHAELALNTFLNSKTPEESRMSLDHYLQSNQLSEKSRGQENLQPGQHLAPANYQQQLVHGVNYQQQYVPANYQQQQQYVPAASYHPQKQLLPPDNPQQQQLPPNNLQQQQLPQQPLHLGLQKNNQQVMSSQVNQQLTAQLLQQRQAMQGYPVFNQRSQIPQPSDHIYNPSMNAQELQPLPNGPIAPVAVQQPQILQSPYGPGIQARNDFFYPPGWPPRMRRIRGKPSAQSRLGPGVYNLPVPVPFKQKPPVEVIYTKPPGFHRGPPPIGNPPVPFEDASPWFPESNFPPPPKDVYYSQLYAQSYDPHYYNYIAKTGKIKPHLYGKLGKHHEEEGEGIWAELYRGFKKHGLKNIMTPTFLLGMTLPVLTLMLSAFVPKRSFSRSDSRELSREDTLEEYVERLQRAMDCYEKKRWKNNDEDVDEC